MPIAAMPTLARERSEVTPPVRIHVHESTLIVYTIAEDHVAILRLLGGRQDWVSILKAGGPVMRAAYAAARSAP